MPVTALPLYTVQGEKHGLVNVRPNSVRHSNLDSLPADKKSDMEKKIKEDKKMVKAKYVNRRNPNGKLWKPYVPCGGEPIQEWVFLCDHVYDVPKGLVDEVNCEKGLFVRNERIEDRQMKSDTYYEKVHEFYAAW